MATISDEISQDAEEWSRKLAVNHPHSLDVSMRRLLSAVTTRFDPTDGLVDAVICWENMFGTDQETTFRVCGALASILEPSDSGKRAELNRELKRIYGVRSKLVHGSRNEPTAQQVVADRDRALGHALNAIRKLHERPELLSLEESAVRSTCLLLDLPPDLVNV